METKIIDFHTHPFYDEIDNQAPYGQYCNMTVESTRQICESLGVTTICGSVICVKRGAGKSWDKIKEANDKALKLREIYGDFYVPGFHVHPEYLEESIAEIDRMAKENVMIMGELVPYFDGWDNYADDNFSLLLDEADKHNMIVSFHRMNNDSIDEMVKNHKQTVFVAAHPGYFEDFERHLERFKMSENYYLDLSGGGISHYGMLRKAIDTVGADRIIFGSDFPCFSLSMYVGAILNEPLLTDTEKEKILYLNAKKLLNLE